MNKNNSYGTINEIVERPNKDIISRFKKHDTAKIVDIMGIYGVMDFEIKPISSGMRIVGPAVTVLTRPGDALFVQKVADVAKEGDVIVVDSDGEKDFAVIGERICYYMKEIRGIAGVVIDGSVRDKAGIIDMSFPTFAKGATPKLSGTQGPGAINVTIQCGGILINPGDIIIGDDDGVVVIPKNDAERILNLADELLKKELESIERLKNGEKLSIICNCDEKIKNMIINE